MKKTIVIKTALLFAPAALAHLVFAGGGGYSPGRR